MNQTQNSAGSSMIYDPVPLFADQPGLGVPTPNAASPAILSYIIRTHETAQDGQPIDTLYFYIGRDRSIPLTSFTISYRISALPIMLDDPEHPYYTYVYTDADIDDHEYLLCSFSLPPDIANAFPGCSAYVSEIHVAGQDTPITHRPGDFVYSEADAEKVQNAMKAVYGEETLGTLPGAGDTAADESAAGTHSTDTLPSENTYDGGEDFPDVLEMTRIAQEKQRKKRRIGVRIFGYTLLLAGVISLISIGVHYLSYQRAMLGAAVYLAAGEQGQAEDYINEEIGGNLFLNSQLSKLNLTVLQLCTEERYNEAFRIVSETPFASVQQRICREASDRALEDGDWETAYVYAFAAPTPFDSEITAAAAEVMLDPYTGSFDENAFRIAQKTADTEALDALLGAIVRYACGENHYHVAMRAAMKLSDEGTAAQTIADVFGIATRYYISKNAFDEVAAFIAAYRADGDAIDEEVEQALIAHFSDSHDADSAFFLAKQFGIDASHIPIAAEDPAIRTDLAGLYPLLTPSQKRAYHANYVTCGGLLLSRSDAGRITLGVHPSGVTPVGGKDTTMTDAQKRITAYLTGKPAVSAMASSQLLTAFVHTDGTVTIMTNRIVGNTAVAVLSEEMKLISSASSLNNVVAVEAGEAHFVFLHEDGTVSCLGDNTYRQCETTGSEWKNIAAIAAGNAFTVGLRTDGTVVACGADSAGQCDVSDLHNVIDVEACERTTVVLFADGSIGLRGERSTGLSAALPLENVVRIRAGSSAVIAELRDGTYTLCGGCAESGNFGSTASWKSLIDFDIGDVCAAALEEGGNLRSTGSNRAKQ